MGTEPEHKFLLLNDDWKKDVSEKKLFVQAYLSKDPGRTVRIRIAGDEAFITIKGLPPEGSISTPEFEYAIPQSDALELMKQCLPGAIEKTRHYVEHEGKTWEIDIFHGANEGLVMAEIELDYEGEAFAKPSWAGEDVTFDLRYKNAMLSSNPYSTWGKPPGKPPSPKGDFRV